MGAVKRRPALRAQGTVQFTNISRIDAVLGGVFDKISSLEYLDKLYQSLPQATGETEFLRHVLDVFHINYELRAVDLTRIPCNGPAIVVANHPFGAIEGVILAHILLKVRSDVRIMANPLLGRVREISGLFFPVDPFGAKDSRRKNLAPLRQAIRWVESGGLLAMFPAGEVAHLQFDKGGITDPVWNATAARLIRITQAKVLPLYFHGHNSLFFQAAGFLHPLLRTVLLPRELINKAHRTIRVRIGSPIPYKHIRHIENDDVLTNYLRVRTYMLGGIVEGHRGPAYRRTSGDGPVLECLIQSPARNLLQAEIEALPAAQTLLTSGSMRVVCTHAQQIPWILQELGRLREITFRSVGEGTGKGADIDLFDSYYLHLILWNCDANEVVGAYRLGLADEILSRYGKQGLYTHSLFKYKRRVLDQLNPAIELGRSFVRTEYQRGFTPLMLLWKGILQFVVRNPRYRVVFGPVSISADYQPLSRRLLVEYLTATYFQRQLARDVKPRHPYRTFGRSAWHGHRFFTTCDIEALSELISDIELGEKGLPILLKHYIKIGGRLLGFNIDEQFGNVIDGLIYVDLCASDRRFLERYMGGEEATAYLNYHGMLSKGDISIIQRLPSSHDRSSFAPSHRARNGLSDRSYAVRN